MQNQLNKIDQLKKELDQYRHLNNHKITEALDLEYTYESNRIEGNTLTLRETDLVISKGLTVSGKSMTEHLEAINHKDAIDYIKDLAIQEIEISERVIKEIHSLVLRGIEKENSGQYRRVPVLISGSKHIPPQPLELDKQMKEFLTWFEENKNVLHPVLMASQLHLRLVTIHPFVDGNGRTSRLLMNLFLIQNGFPIVIIKGDTESRLSYYEALENSQVNGSDDFDMFIVEYTNQSLNRMLEIIK